MVPDQQISDVYFLLDTRKLNDTHAQHSINSPCHRIPDQLDKVYRLHYIILLYINTFVKLTYIDNFVKSYLRDCRVFPLCSTCAIVFGKSLQISFNDWSIPDIMPL